ncbi:MAG TPA: hypothetical protein VHU91_02515 [Mycobacteriales bacterium]|nr:hypothetical protein [Mycobacteriales bacterium]
MSIRPKRPGIFVALGAVLTAAALATAAFASPATAASPAHHTSQPYRALVTKDFGSGGTYISTGGTIALKLNPKSQGVDAFAEECDGGGDLGDVQHFPAGASTSRVLASNVSKDQCFVLLLKSTGSQTTEVSGTLDY